ncbi:MAG TPA: histidine kinase [Anaerovoracaceae bacterium]|nr:histidine kinase [Anaerovoracaceae bacterium]
MKKLDPVIFRHILIFAVICIAFLIWIQESNPDYPQAKDGVLDLSQWDLNSASRMTLSGEWEFHWGEFLTGQDYKDNSHSQSIYADVPQIWNRYQLNGQNLPGFGYATYHLKVKVPDTKTILGLRISSMSTAYKFYINDRLLAQNGKISTSIKDSAPQYDPATVIFAPPAEEFDIIVHVSNYTYARGGMWFDIDFGTAEQIHEYESFLKYKDGIVIGILSFMTIIFFLYYYMVREDRKNVSFILMCLILIIRTSLNGDYLIIRLFPDISFNLLVWLFYLTAIWFPVILNEMIEYFIGEKKNNLRNKIFLIYAAAFSVIAALTPVSLYTQWSLIMDFMAVIIVATALFNAFLAHLKKKHGANLVFLGGFIVALSGLNDMLYQANLIRSPMGEIMPIGLIIFMLLLFLLMADRFSRTFREVQSLSMELAEKLELEHDLTERLYALVNKLATAEMSFLQAQIKPHFIHNALSVISSLSIKDPHKAKSLILDLSDYLRGSFDLNNDEGLTTLSKELELVQAYVSIEQARFKERLQVYYHLLEEVDCTLPLLTIQPLVENAIRHGIMCRMEGGEIHITTSLEPDHVRIEVRDNGVGMESDRILKFFELKQEERGVGMVNIHRRLLTHYGEGLHIDSSPGQGTIIYFSVPYHSGKEEMI